MAQRGLSQARRVLPFFRPHAGKLAIVLGMTIATALAEGGQAALLQPLLNEVLLSGGDEEADKADREAKRHAVQRSRAECDAALLRAGAGAVATLESDVAALVPFAGRAAADPAWSVDSACQLVERTRQVLVRVERNLGPDDQARKDLARAVARQREAERLLLPDPRRASPAARDAAVWCSFEGRTDARDASYHGVQRTLIDILIYALLLAVVLGVSRYFAVAISGEVAARVYQDLQAAVVSRVLTLSLGQVQETRRGDLISRLTSDLQRVAAGVLMPMLEVVVIFPARILFLYVVAVLVSWELALCLVGLALLIFVPMRWWGKFIRRSARVRQGALADVLEAMHQMLAGMRIVKVFRREAWERERFRRTTDRAYDAEVAAIQARTASRTWIALVNDVTFPFVLLAGGWIVVNRVWQLDAGRFATFAVLMILMYRPMRALMMAYNTLQDSLPSMVRALEVLDMRPLIVNDPAKPALERLEGDITFEGVSFSYDGQHEVLEDVSFTARVGTTTAFVGQTGSGKSTLMDLLARFIDPTRGRILVGGRPLGDLRLESWQARLALVPQEVFLFNDTVRENIRYGRLDASDAEVEQAARQARIHDDIVSRAEGYGYVVGDRGTKLSGGQQQRVTIARAILRAPDVLLLDEGTSALDAHTERQVQETLRELERGRTTFVVAHRLSTVRHADQLLVLAHGRIVERGTHEELIAKGGLYAELVKHMEDPEHRA